MKASDLTQRSPRRSRARLSGFTILPALDEWRADIGALFDDLDLRESL